MAALIILQGGEATRYDLPDGETVIGRHPDCQIRLQSNMVSRKHARIFARDGQFLIEDMGSGNGSFLNGQPVVEPMPLKHEDRIKLGPILLRYESMPAGAAAGHPALLPGLGPDGGFRFDLASGENDQATIMGTASGGGRFGMLDVRPEAKLKAVLEISRSLAGSVDLESLLPRILESLFSIFPHADRGCILLRDPASGQMIPRAFRHRRPSDEETFKLSRTILNRVLEEKTGILSADAASDARFQASESISSLTIRSLLCVPLLSLEGDVTGIINIDTQNALRQFTPDDLDLLMAVAGQAALSYESARLLVSHIERQKYESEMRIAAQVQHSLLPARFPAVPGYEFFASYEAAQAVGGDYYDCRRLDDQHVFLAFGDVAGKGVPAALVMSRIASVVENTLGFVTDVERAMERINNHMCSAAVDGRFVTFVLIVIDLETHTITVSNGGHMAPIVRRPDGTVEEIGAAAVGIPVGVVEDYPFESVSRKLEPGETIVIYTDGVSEAMNADAELYGLERLRELIARTEGNAEAIGSAILADVRRHAAGFPQNDDITVMTFGRTA